MSNQSVSDLKLSKEKVLEKFFRFGLVSKGIVYCLSGLLAVMAAVGLGAKGSSKTGAFNFIHEQPFGRILLGVIAIGIFGFVVMRLFQSFEDVSNHGSRPRALLVRSGYAISALIYGSLGVYAVKLVLNGNSDSGNLPPVNDGKGF